MYILGVEALCSQDQAFLAIMSSRLHVRGRHVAFLICIRLQQGAQDIRAARRGMAVWC